MAYNRKEHRDKGRDSRGVRINNYSETVKRGWKQNPAPDNDMTQTLIDTFKRNISNTITTGEGVEVERKASGRPPKYPTLDSFVNVINEYIEYINEVYNTRGVDLIPDIEGFCAFAGISRETLNTWEAERDKAFSDTIKELKTQIAGYKKQLGLKGKIPPIVLAMDFNNNHGYTQQNTLEIKHRTILEELPAVDVVRDKVPQIDTQKGHDTDVIDI